MYSWGKAASIEGILFCIEVSPGILVFDKKKQILRIIEKSDIPIGKGDYDPILPTYIKGLQVIKLLATLPYTEIRLAVNKDNNHREIQLLKTRLESGNIIITLDVNHKIISAYCPENRSVMSTNETKTFGREGYVAGSCLEKVQRDLHSYNAILDWIDRYNAQEARNGH